METLGHQFLDDLACFGMTVALLASRSAVRTVKWRHGKMLITLAIVLLDLFLAPSPTAVKRFDGVHGTHDLIEPLPEILLANEATVCTELARHELADVLFLVRMLVEILSIRRNCLVDGHDRLTRL